MMYWQKSFPPSLSSMFLPALTVGFSESDYTERENAMGRDITVVRTEDLADSLFVIVKALTYEEFNQTGRALPSALQLSTLPDPAECKIELLDWGMLYCVAVACYKVYGTYDTVHMALEMYLNYHHFNTLPYAMTVPLL